MNPFFVAAIAAGFINTLAGNGSSLTLPLLIFMGLPPHSGRRYQLHRRHSPNGDERPIPTTGQILGARAAARMAAQRWVYRLLVVVIVLAAQMFLG